MGPSDRPLRGHRAPSLIFLGFAQTLNSLREFLVPQFNRIEVLFPLNKYRGIDQSRTQ